MEIGLGVVHRKRQRTAALQNVRRFVSLNLSRSVLECGSPLPLSCLATALRVEAPSNHQIESAFPHRASPTPPRVQGRERFFLCERPSSPAVRSRLLSRLFPRVSISRRRP